MGARESGPQPFTADGMQRRVIEYARPVGMLTGRVDYTGYMRAFLHWFDLYFTTIIRHLPDWIRPVMVSATMIGRPFFTIGIGLLIVILGWQANEPLFQAGLFVVGTCLVGSLLKILLRRKRPPTEYALSMPLKTFSFPSGHAVGSTIAYGTIGYLCFYFLPPTWGGLVVGLTVTLICLVGVSRVYLGAHYPSDVAAGWALGGAGLFFIVTLIQPKSLPMLYSVIIPTS